MSTESGFDQAIKDAELNNRAVIRSGRDGVTVYVRAEGEPPPIVDLFFGGVVIVLDSCEPAITEAIERAFQVAADRYNETHETHKARHTLTADSLRRPL